MRSRSWFGMMGVLAAALAMPVVGGCEHDHDDDDTRTLKHEEERKVKRDGTVVEERSTVKQKSDGTVVEEKTTSVDKRHED